MLEYIIDRMWKASYANSTSLVKVFQKRKYELPLPIMKTRKSHSLNLLRSIKNDDLFSNPILNHNGQFLENNSKVSFPIDINGKASRRIFGLIDECTKSPYFYSIYGISENSWFPVFNRYPEILFKEFDLQREFTDAKVKEAELNIPKFEKSQDNYFSNINFRLFNKLLYSPDVIKNIANIIMYLPDEIIIKFDPIIARAESISVNDPKMIILSHNAIVLFRNIFNEKCQQIYNNHFSVTISPLSQKEIEKQINIYYDNYCSDDENATHFDIYSPTIEKFNIIKKEIKEIKIEARHQNEEKHDAYLCEYKDNLITTPKKRNEQPQYVSISNSNKNSLNDKNNIQIQLPKVKYVKELSLQTIPKLREFYNSHIKGIRLLPVFASVMKSKNDPKMEEEAIQYFDTLLQIYENLPDRDFSIISSTTNLFNESFASMIGKFQKAGVNFKIIVPKKCIIPEEDYQEFIELPEKEKITPLPPERWSIFNPYLPFIPIITEEEDHLELDKTIKPSTIFVLNDPQSMPITNEQLDGLISSFTDKMGIERTLNRIDKMEPNTSLKIYDTNAHEVKSRQILDTTKTNFPIMKLMQQGLYFANKFYIAASEMDIPRSEFAVNILVDCSSFISDENKIFNMLIICALTHTLNTIEIPYSVAVIADQNFKCIIKEFEEPHSIKCLQKICECLLIKRFRTKLAT